MVPRCQKCNADRRKVIIVRNGVGHVTDLELDVSVTLSQCPSGDPAPQVHSSKRSHGSRLHPELDISVYRMKLSSLMLEVIKKSEQTSVNREEP